MPNNKSFEDLRNRAEQLIKQRKTRVDVSAQDLEQLIHELEVHQIELEIQNSELHEAIEALNIAREENEKLFTFAPVAYLALEDERIKQANLRAAKLLQYEPADLIGEKFATFIPPSDQDVYYLHQREVSKSPGLLHECELRLQKQNGEMFYAQLHSEQPMNGTTRIAIIDVSQKREAKAALEASLQRERELSRLKSQFLEIISHEFRTPLATIHSAIEMIAKYGDRLSEDKRQKRFDNIHNQIWYLNDMLQDVVIAHRSGETTMPYRPETFDVVERLENLIRSLNDLEKADRISLEHNATQSPEMVTWDAQLFRRIIFNLLQNALKYSADEVQCILNISNETITIVVKDKGEGIPPEDQKAIFDMFYRGSNTTSIPGTGIGLAVVKQATQAHGGTAKFSSDSEGTKFSVYLPRHVHTQHL